MVWVKGQSGNPSGKKAVPPEIKEAFNALTPRAVEVLAELLECDNPKIRLTAAQTVLDRSLGKATTPVDVKVGGSLNDGHLEALQRLSAAAGAIAGPVPVIDITPAPAEKPEE